MECLVTIIGHSCGGISGQIKHAKRVNKKAAYLGKAHRFLRGTLGAAKADIHIVEGPSIAITAESTVFPDPTMSTFRRSQLG